jgi:hypothetical protein
MSSSSNHAITRANILGAPEKCHYPRLREATCWHPSHNNGHTAELVIVLCQLRSLGLDTEANLAKGLAASVAWTAV